MANKQFSGYLRDPLGDYANNDKYRFTHVSTTGEVIKGSTSYFNVDDTGFYDFTIEYGNVTIESYSELGKRWINQGTTTINADTTATTLPALLNALVPASDPLLVELQALLADAEQASSDAQDAASDAEAAAAQFTKATTAQAVEGDDDAAYMTPRKTLSAQRAYGIGSLSSVNLPGGDLNSLTTPSGFYRTTNTESGDFPAGASKFGYIGVYRYDSVNVYQEYLGILSDVKYIRRGNSTDGWRPWAEIYTSANAGDAVTKDVIVSQFDTTANRVLTTGAGGILGNSPSFDDWNALPQGFAGFAVMNADAANTPSGLDSSRFYAITYYGDTNRQALCMEQGAPNAFKLRRTAGTWVYDGEFYGDWNANFNDFGGSPLSVIMNGRSTAGFELRCTVPINSKTPPTSITLTGSLSVSSWGSGAIIESGITNVILDVAKSSSKVAVIFVEVSNSFGVADWYQVKVDDASSKITVNF